MRHGKINSAYTSINKVIETDILRNMKGSRDISSAVSGVGEDLLDRDAIDALINSVDDSADVAYLSGRIDYFSDHANLSGLAWSEAGHVIDTDIDMDSNSLTNVSLIDFDTTLSATFQEGRLAWDSDNGTLTLGMPGGTVNLQIGQEMYLRAKADQDITNGQLVYITGASGNNPTADLASCSGIMASKVIAMATEDVTSAQFGYFTTVGVVNEISVPTATYSEGDELYLGETYGTFTNTRPVYPCTAVKIGYVLRAHDTEGKVLIAINSEEWRRNEEAQKEPTGFPLNYPDLMGDISFDDGTRTFQIAPKSGQDFFAYFLNGAEFRHTSARTVQITDTEGLWYIYFENDTLTASQTPWSFDNGQTFVAILYWDATNKKSALGEERHGITMDQDTHEYLHNTAGATYREGFTPSLTVDGDGSLDAHAEMQAVTAGSFYDEDILNSNDEQTTYEIWWKEGASPVWRWDTGSAALVKMAATRPYYNQYTGGAWQLTEAPNTRYMLMHLFAANRAGSTNKIIVVMGEDVYITNAAAQTAAETEIYDIVTGMLPTPEFVEIASVIIQIADSYTNSYNARVVSTSEGADFVDFRTNEKIGVGAVATDHGNLVGLGDDDHTQYSLVDGTRAFTGAVAGVTPTLSGHLTTKSYVDGVDATKVGGASNLTTQYRMTYVSSAGQLTESASILTDASGNITLQGSNAYTRKIRTTYGAGAPTYYFDWGYNSDGNKVYLTITDNNTPINALVANYTGWVGVGGATTATGTEKFNVTGDGEAFLMRASSANAAIYQSLYNSAGARRAYFGFGGTSSSIFDIVNQENGAMRFHTNNTVALTLDASQNATFAGDVIQNPSASVTPANNGELMVEATSNTTLTFKLKGSDGTVRSGTITLS